VLYTVFTQIQDDSNLRQFPPVMHVNQGKIYFFESKVTPLKKKNKISAKKRYLTIYKVVQI